jgi:transposase-like protein
MKNLHALKSSPTGAAASSSAVGETQGVRRTTGGSPTAGAPVAEPPTNSPDPEVPEKKPRRRFTATYKLRVLHLAEQCSQPGEIGALLRKEALYSSHLTTWRRQRQEGSLQGLSPKRRGRKAKPTDPSAELIARLEKENLRLKLNLRKAEIIIEAQKKISEILGIDQNLENSPGSS